MRHVYKACQEDCHHPYFTAQWKLKLIHSRNRQYKDVDIQSEAHSTDRDGDVGCFRFPRSLLVLRQCLAGGGYRKGEGRDQN